MNNTTLVDLVTQLMWIVLMTSLPTVLVASLVGIVISLVQALTQIQDQTVQFTIKLLAVALTLLISYHWLGGILLGYTNQVMQLIGSVAR